jgi:hypothetical protein
MPPGNERLFEPEYEYCEAGSFARIRAKAFQVPPIRDAAVLGRLAPVSREVMQKTLRVMSSEPFVSLDVRDDTIASIFVRQTILRRISAERIKRIVLRSIKPLMAKTEILALNLEIEIELGGIL